MVSSSMPSANAVARAWNAAGREWADLSFANLRSANLGFADLSFADPRSADLRSANLRSANLRSANLRSANLRFANLSSTSCLSVTGLPSGHAILAPLPPGGGSPSDAGPAPSPSYAS